MAGLSIITPTHNPHYFFHQKTKSLASNHPDWQIIVIDDHSDIAVERYLPRLPNLEIYRNSSCIGAGACRNFGLQQIRKDYTVFLDDDDEMYWDIVQSALTRMEQDPSVDVSFYHYNILFNGTHKSAIDSDCQILSRALFGSHERLISIDGNEMLLSFTNYPWNKVYRSSFITRAGLRFSDTPVQNDVLAHWITLLRADKIFLNDTPMCTKVEFDKAERIGNIGDARCIQAFQALRETYQLVQLEGTKRAKIVFCQFYLKMVWWLFSKCPSEIRVLIFHEHKAFIELLESNGFLELAESSVKRWHLWEIPIMSDDAEARPHSTSTGSDISEYSIVLAEMSRLKRLAAELRAENEMLRTENDAQIAANQALMATNNSLRALSSRKIVRVAVLIGDFFHARFHRKKIS